MIRVLIVEPFTVLRHGLRLILQANAGLAIAGEAATGAEAIDRASGLQPDVILIEIKLPDWSGAQTIEELRRAAPQGRILVLTTSERSEDILDVMKAGARGYLLKDVSSAEVVQAIEQVACGQPVLPPLLTAHLLDELAAPSPEPLTDRERDVLQYVTQGLGNKEIAFTLSISQNTVKTHVRRILTKLNLRSRTQAATYALQRGLLFDE